ncbi:hypothetical protein B0H65DRAFT_481622 [Neurospora tetraspora]|uniref:Uncharacterized protein n=1 Tax=Neurospora tetraspora TaxID=94610 RepID=A0AAE0J0L7_9PEZI|nr:hypothetical protein B0H65DRAFT_481622 [Neurospora tetraspora]
MARKAAVIKVSFFFLLDSRYSTCRICPKREAISCQLMHLITRAFGSPAFLFAGLDRSLCRISNRLSGIAALTPLTFWKKMVRADMDLATGVNTNSGQHLKTTSQ